MQEEKKEMDQSDDDDMDDSDSEEEDKNELYGISRVILSFEPGTGNGRNGKYKIAVRDGAISLGEPETEQIVAQYLRYVALLRPRCT